MRNKSESIISWINWRIYSIYEMEISFINRKFTPYMEMWETGMKKERRRIKGNNRRTGIVNRCLVLLLAMMICFSCLQVPVMANDTEEETEKQRKVTIYVVSITGNELTYYEIESEEEEETEVEDSEEQSGATETSDSEEKSGELETSDSEEQSGELETSDSEEQSDGADVNS